MHFGDDTGAYFSCFLVARKPPSALKRGGAHLEVGGDALHYEVHPCNSTVFVEMLIGVDSFELNSTIARPRLG